MKHCLVSNTGCSIQFPKFEQVRTLLVIPALHEALHALHGVQELVQGQLLPTVYQNLQVRQIKQQTYAVKYLKVTLCTNFMV